jgi:hypothetical protein
MGWGSGPAASGAVRPAAGPPGGMPPRLRSQGSATASAGITRMLVSLTTGSSARCSCQVNPLMPTSPKYAQAHATTLYHPLRFAGRAISVAAGHMRYWTPNDAVVSRNAPGATVARSMGCARRHHHTAATTAASAIPDETHPITEAAWLPSGTRYRRVMIADHPQVPMTG